MSSSTCQTSLPPSIMQDRADPHARERAFNIARRDPPAGVPSEQAVAAIGDVLESIGDTCPECPPDEAASSVLRSRQ